MVCKSADCSLVCAQILALPSTCPHGMSTASSEAPPFTWPQRWCVGASMIPGWISGQWGSFSMVSAVSTFVKTKTLPHKLISMYSIQGLHAPRTPHHRVFNDN